MKKLILLAATLGSFVAFAAPKSSNPQQLIDNVQTAFNKQDAKQLSQLFAPDATLITPDGRAHHGQASIEKDMSQMFGSTFKGAQSHFRIDGQRAIGGNVLWLDATHTATNILRADGKRGTQTFHLVMLLEKVGDNWEIVEGRPYVLQPASQLGIGGAGK